MVKGIVLSRNATSLNECYRIIAESVYLNISNYNSNNYIKMITTAETYKIIITKILKKEVIITTITTITLLALFLCLIEIIKTTIIIITEIAIIIIIAIQV